MTHFKFSPRGASTPSVRITDCETGIALPFTLEGNTIKFKDPRQSKGPHEPILVSYRLGSGTLEEMQAGGLYEVREAQGLVDRYSQGFPVLRRHRSILKDTPYSALREMKHVPTNLSGSITRFPRFASLIPFIDVQVMLADIMPSPIGQRFFMGESEFWLDQFLPIGEGHPFSSRRIPIPIKQGMGRFYREALIGTDQLLPHAVRDVRKSLATSTVYLQTVFSRRHFHA